MLNVLLNYAYIVVFLTQNKQIETNSREASFVRSYRVNSWAVFRVINKY